MSEQPHAASHSREAGASSPRALGSTFGAHVYLWATSSAAAELDRAIAAAAALDVDFVQVSLSSTDLDVAALKASLKRHRMGCLAGLAVPPAVWAARHEGGLGNYLRRAVQITAELGGELLSGALYTPMGERSDADERTASLSLIANELRATAIYARGLGIRLGLEPLNRYETSLINTCEQALRLISEVGEPNVVVHVDTFHMNIEEQDLCAAIRLAGERLGYIQLAEADRGVPGDGHLPWDDVFRGLRDVGYRGPIAFESFALQNTVLAQAACLWRDVVGDPDAFVANGRRQMQAVAQQVGYPFPALRPGH
jgi:D-psicose/D-tagatose/L-ribulose 3-epimerase